MTVEKVFTNEYEVSLEPNIHKDDELVFKIGVLCNNSEIQIEEGKEKLIGDPTESALLVSAKKVSLKVSELQALPRIKENPFDSSRKMMSVIVEENSNKIVYLKGAPERVLEKCTSIYVNGIVKNLDEKIKSKILEKNDEFAKGALRVLAFAYKNFNAQEEDEQNLIFVGLQAMMDPPSDEVPDSIKKCREAGIRVIMITGDNQKTAEAIAKEIGITGKSINGKDFSALSDEMKLSTIKETNIFARVEPEHKMMIVNLLQLQGEIVAMTGDGVNDAPAIKKSDIGIAMGIRGTDVTKETSDMILLDDNFSTIVNTIEEGRGIRSNITKFVNYLVSSNLAEIFIILFAMILNFPLPMTAIMLLWLNLVTDGLPALALGLDKNPSDIMKIPPTKKSQILNKKTAVSMLTISILITIATLSIFYLALQEYSSLPQAEILIKAQTIAFTTIVMMELVRLQAIRSEHKVKMFSNHYLTVAVGSSIALQLAAIYTPLNLFFGTTPLNLFDWQLILGATLSVFIINLIINKALRIKKSN
jgi:Ca2+-transporting ATPase